MKLSKIYSNRPHEFNEILFVGGLNVIVGEIRNPNNLRKDTHNLGKTTLCSLIDFLLLRSKDPTFFLFKHENVFSSYVFYIELELFDGSFLTLRRSVAAPTKISFKKHTKEKQDFSFESAGFWSHEDIAFEKARNLLDSYLDLYSIKPFNYRSAMGYQLRSQDDYNDVFHLKKFKGGHSDWKPFLAKILGFDSDQVIESYKIETELENKIELERNLKFKLGGDFNDASTVEGMLLLKQQDARKKRGFVDEIDFRGPDAEKVKVLVEELDAQLSELNLRRYSLLQRKKKINDSMSNDLISFDTDKANAIFNEAGILFEGQIKKDFQQLLDFNKSISIERNSYLKEELFEINAELELVISQINEAGEKRTNSLSFLTDTDIFRKYREISDELVVLLSEIKGLERQKGFIDRLQSLRLEKENLEADLRAIHSRIRTEVNFTNSNQESLFSTIRLHFNQIVEEVIDKKALLSVRVNKNGHLEFEVEILNDKGGVTSASSGHTYKKLLCVAFDLALMLSHRDDRYPRFVYHDGIFESLDPRKKENLLNVLRRCGAVGLQPIITLINSDIPATYEGGVDGFFTKEEVILTLHDGGHYGRLFKLPEW